MNRELAMGYAARQSHPMSGIARADVIMKELKMHPGVLSVDGVIMEYGTSKRLSVRVAANREYRIYCSFRAPVFALRSWELRGNVWLEVDGRCAIGDSMMLVLEKSGLQHIPKILGSSPCEGCFTQLDGKLANLFEVIFSELP